MTDVFTIIKRSEVMSRIKSRDTQPERAVRSLLHRLGYRFRLHRADLPGKPDIVLPRYKTVIFVNGCFWHRHEGCRFAYTPKTRIDFWQKKFSENVFRDQRAQESLMASGWKVIVIWECELREQAALGKRLETKLVGQHDELTQPKKG